MAPNPLIKSGILWTS